MILQIRQIKPNDIYDNQIIFVIQQLKNILILCIIKFLLHYKNNLNSKLTRLNYMNFESNFINCTFTSLVYMCQFRTIHNVPVLGHQTINYFRQAKLSPTPTTNQIARCSSAAGTPLEKKNMLLGHQTINYFRQAKLSPII